MTDGDAPRGGAAEPELPAAAETDVTLRLIAAVDVFETFRDELNALLREVRRGDSARARKLAPAVAELARAVTRIAEEEGKLHGVRREIGGAAVGPALDLAAARREVCRRLAELRSRG